MIKLNGEIVPVTIFPDGTHQVWKLTNSQIEYIKTSKEIEVLWEFENQAEVFDIMQLTGLLEELLFELLPYNTYQLVLNCPYLPYARQDKEFSNSSCFALRPLTSHLLSLFDIIRTVDVHNSSFFDDWLFSIENTFPIEVINSIVSKENVDLIVFPDEGAMKRYKEYVPDGIPFISAKKSRDQLTGNILGITINAQEVNEKSSVLVWDDICDGGGTFIGLAAHIKVPKLMLYVSHGIFSKGTACLFSAGYNKLFTRKGQVQ